MLYTLRHLNTRENLRIQGELVHSSHFHSGAISLLETEEVMLLGIGLGSLSCLASIINLVLHTTAAAS